MTGSVEILVAARRPAHASAVYSMLTMTEPAMLS